MLPLLLRYDPPVRVVCPCVCVVLRFDAGLRDAVGRDDARCGGVCACACGCAEDLALRAGQQLISSVMMRCDVLGCD